MAATVPPSEPLRDVRTPARLCPWPTGGPNVWKAGAAVGRDEAVQVLCAALGVSEGADFVVACDRLRSGWRVQQLVDDPMQHLGLRPWVVSDAGQVATVPFGASAQEVLLALAGR